MIEQLRTLPLRVPYHSGEALDSWLIRLAQRNGTTLFQIAPDLGLTGTYKTHHAFVRDLVAPRLRSIERQTGLVPGSLDGAVLNQFDVLEWPSISGSRYCIQCLRSPEGAWAIRWRLTYAVACVKHHCLLATVCPSCDLPPHQRHLGSTGALPSHFCARRLAGSRSVCGADLLANQIITLESGDPRLSAQRWIDERLDRMDPPSLTDLRDLGTLAEWFHRRVRPFDIPHLGPATVSAVDCLREKGLRPSRHHRPEVLLVDAAVLHLAVELLAAEDQDVRYQRFTPLFRHISNTSQTHFDSPAPNVFAVSQLAKLSRARQAQLLSTCGPHLRTTEQLRWYTHTAQPRLPESGCRLATDRARWVPRRLWQDWLVRFTPPQGFHASVLAIDVPAWLLLPGNLARNQTVSAELGPWRTRTSPLLGLMAASYPDVLTAFSNIADYLDKNGGAIDYRRRRETFTDIELPDEAWARICASSESFPGTGPKRLQSRLYLYALLTGADIRSADVLPGDPDEGIKASFIHRFRWPMPRPFRRELHRYARHLLAAAGIDEPLRWSPPATCAAGLQLPGPHLDAMPAALVTECIERHRMSMRTAAQHLHTTRPHVLYLAEQNTSVESDKLNGQVQVSTSFQIGVIKDSLRRPAAYQLTPDFLKEQLIEKAKKVEQVADETGFHRGTVRNLAQTYGVLPAPVPNPRLNNKIDPVWLRHQIEVLHRTNFEIAAEIGVKLHFLRKVRKELGIAPDERWSQNGPLRPELPAGIRKAVEDQQEGWTRLYRFQQVMAFPNVAAAARELEYHNPNLWRQFTQLERASPRHRTLRACRSGPTHAADGQWSTTTRGTQTARSTSAAGAVRAQEHQAPPFRMSDRRTQQVLGHQETLWLL
jgi:hypothetical protein